MSRTNPLSGAQGQEPTWSTSRVSQGPPLISALLQVASQVFTRQGEQNSASLKEHKAKLTENERVSAVAENLGISTSHLEELTQTSPELKQLVRSHTLTPPKKRKAKETSQVPKQVPKLKKQWSSFTIRVPAKGSSKGIAHHVLVKSKKGSAPKITAICSKEISRIGKGSYAHVHGAGEKMAVKVAKSQEDAEMAETVLSEMQKEVKITEEVRSFAAAHGMSSDGLPAEIHRVYDYHNPEQVVPMLGMQRGKGDGTDLLLHQINSPSTDSREQFATNVGYMKQLVNGLTVFHEAGIIHHDLKWENAIVRDDKLWLSDFGESQKIETIKEHPEDYSPANGTPGYYTQREITDLKEASSDYLMAFYDWKQAGQPEQGPLAEAKDKTWATLEHRLQRRDQYGVGLMLLKMASVNLVILDPKTPWQTTGPELTKEDIAALLADRGIEEPKLVDLLAQLMNPNIDERPMLTPAFLAEFNAVLDGLSTDKLDLTGKPLVLEPRYPEDCHPEALKQLEANFTPVPEGVNSGLVKELAAYRQNQLKDYPRLWKELSKPFSLDEPIGDQCRAKEATASAIQKMTNQAKEADELLKDALGRGERLESFGSIRQYIDHLDQQVKSPRHRGEADNHYKARIDHAYTTSRKLEGLVESRSNAFVTQLNQLKRTSMVALAPVSVSRSMEKIISDWKNNWDLPVLQKKLSESQASANADLLNLPSLPEEEREKALETLGSRLQEIDKLRDEILSRYQELVPMDDPDQVPDIFYEMDQECNELFAQAEGLTDDPDKYQEVAIKVNTLNDILEYLQSTY